MTPSSSGRERLHPFWPDPVPGRCGYGRPGRGGGPVIMAVTTTVVAFMPLMFIAGIMGKFIGVMPRAVVAILVVSLGEALVILPAPPLPCPGAVPESQRPVTPSPRTGARPDRGRPGSLHQRHLRPLPRLRPAQSLFYPEHRVWGCLVISLGIVIGGYVPFVFMPN